jgi:hypothetical protein
MFVRHANAESLDLASFVCQTVVLVRHGVALYCLVLYLGARSAVSLLVYCSTTTLANIVRYHLL